MTMKKPKLNIVTLGCSKNKVDSERLAASLSHRGDPGHPVVLAAIDDAICRIVASGKAAGILDTDQSLVRHYLALGCTFVAVGLDVSVLAAGLRRLRADYSDIGPRP